MTEAVIQLIESMGYLGIAGLMLLEIVFPPIPSEIVMPFAGFAASQGNLTISGVILAGTIGSVVGSLLLYGLGALIHEEKIQRWIEKFGRRIGLHHKDVIHSQQWFDRNGIRAVLIGRVIPGIRSIISLPAGMRRMKIRTFLIYTTIGSTIWNIGLAGSGYLLGDAYAQVEHMLGPISKIVAILLVLAVGVFFWRRSLETKSAKQP
jgi:membrane protein DedA with SNARE-associated domain